MSPIKITIHSTGAGCCSLTGKETDGLTVTFDDGTVREAFLSFRAFKQLLAMKTAQSAKCEAKSPNGASNPPAPTIAQAPAK